MELSAEARRESILNDLASSDKAKSASSLAKDYNVSRQIIVGDVAILRAAGNNIIATPRGYIFESDSPESFPCMELIACNHDEADMAEELYTIVDFGATVLDVTIEHPVYGQIVGNLNLSSRYDVNTFIAEFQKAENASPISMLTGGAHLHKIGARDQETIQRIRLALKEKGILIS